MSHNKGQFAPKQFAVEQELCVAEFRGSDGTSLFREKLEAGFRVKNYNSIQRGDCVVVTALLERKKSGGS